MNRDSNTDNMHHLLKKRMEEAWQVRRTDTARAKAIATEVLQEASEIGNLQAQAMARCILGLAYVYVGEYDSGNDHLQQALSLLKAKGADKIWLVRTMNAMGYHDCVVGAFGKGLLVLKQALELSKMHHVDEMTVFILYNIAELYMDVLKNPDHAQLYYREVLDLCESGLSHPLCAPAHLRVGLYEATHGNFEAATYHGNAARSMSEKSKDPFGQALSYEMSARLKLMQGQLDEALMDSDRAYALREQIGDQYATAATHELNAAIYYELKNYEAAIHHGLLALRISAKIHSRGSVEDVLKTIASAHERQGNFALASQFYKAYSNKRRLQFSEDLKNLMSVMSSEMEFEALKKDAEIHRLRNVELKQKTLEIEGIVANLEQTLATLKSTQQQLVQAEKMASLGELVAGVAHQINTPLGVSITLNSYLLERNRDLASAVAEAQLTKGKLDDYLETTGQVIDSMSHNLGRVDNIVKEFKSLALHQHVFTEGPVVLHQLIDESMQLAFLRFHPDRSTHRFTYSIVCEPGCDPNMVVNMPADALGSVLNQLVLNTFEHGFKDRTTGHITVSLGPCPEHEGGLCLTFADNGSGIAPQMLAKAFDPFVSSSKRTGALGLGLHRVHNIITHILGGSIELSSGGEVKGDGGREAFGEDKGEDKGEVKSGREEMVNSNGQMKVGSEGHAEAKSGREDGEIRADGNVAENEDNAEAKSGLGSINKSGFGDVSNVSNESDKSSEGDKGNVSNRSREGDKANVSNKSSEGDKGWEGENSKEGEVGLEAAGTVVRMRLRRI